MCLSDPQTAVARTRIRTSAWPGWGTGTVLISVADGPAAALVLTTACILRGGVGEGERGGVGDVFILPLAPSPTLPLLFFLNPPPRRLERSRCAGPRPRLHGRRHPRVGRSGRRSGACPRFGASRKERRTSSRATRRSPGACRREGSRTPP